MMGRLYADEDFPFGAVQILRTLGHDVLTVREAGRGGKPDLEVLADATADGRAVLTHNHRHYQRLHGRSQAHGGIISCSRDDHNLSALAQRVHDAVSAASDLMHQFVRIIRPNRPAKP